MTPDNFGESLQLVQPEIQKQNTKLHEAIPAKVELAATISFLVTGSNYADLQYILRVHKSTISRFIPEVCEALYNQLKDEHLKVCCFITRLTKTLYILKKGIYCRKEKVES